MDHPIFIAGEMTTAFIEEQYPDGLKGLNCRMQTCAALRGHCGDAPGCRNPARAGVGPDGQPRTQSGHGLERHAARAVFDVVISADQTALPSRLMTATILRCRRLDTGRSTWPDVGRRRAVGAESGQNQRWFPRSGRAVRDIKVHVRTPRQAELAA